MSTYIVLLRGVNVGKAKRVTMTDFKQTLIDVGCTRVTTLLNSGNAVVDHQKTPTHTLAKTVSDAIATRFGFAVPVIVKSFAELGTVVNGLGFAVAEENQPKLLVAFGQSEQAIASLDALATLVMPPEQVQFQQHAAYLFCANGILESKAAEALLGKVGTSVTTRNWATVLKLHALAIQNGA